MIAKLISLTDGNFLCETCGCIIHGSVESRENHTMWHKLIYEFYKHLK